MKPSWHWTNQPNAEEIKTKCVKNLKHDYWKGKERDDETKKKISKTKTGVSIWGGKRETPWMLGNKLAAGHTSWNKGIPHKAVMGDKNINWRGGVTSINDKIRKSIDYKRWRTSVFKRDNYTCVWCKESKSGKLEADHIKPFAYFPKLRFTISNGRTLCRDCHKKTDTYLSGAKKIYQDN